MASVRLYVTKWALERFGPIRGVVMMDITEDQLVAWRERANYAGGLAVPREALAPFRGVDVFFFEQIPNGQWFTDHAEAWKAVEREVKRELRQAKTALEHAKDQYERFRRNGPVFAETVEVKKARRKQEREAKQAKEVG